MCPPQSVNTCSIPWRRSACAISRPPCTCPMRRIYDARRRGHRFHGGVLRAPTDSSSGELRASGRGRHLGAVPFGRVALGGRGGQAGDAGGEREKGSSPVSSKIGPKKAAQVMGVLMTWVTTTDGPSQEQHARNAPSPPPTQSEGSREPWSLPRAMWDEEPGWDDRRVVVVEASALRALGTAAAMEGYLWIPLEPPRPVHRGKLALHIEESIESALQQRGAPFPGIGASTDLDASLGDQLYRARLVEMRGIALGVPDLGGIANLRGVLEAEDSAVLRWWLAAALDRPVRVVLSAENRAYRVYPSPVGFDALLEGFKGSFGDAPSPRAPSAETAQSVVAMELSELFPAVTEEGADDLAADVELPELDRALGLEPAPDRLELCPAEGDASDEPEAPDALAAEAFASDSARALAEALIVSAEESPGGAARVEPIADPIADPIAEPSAEVASDPTVAVAASEPEAALVASAEVDSAQVDSAQVDSAQVDVSAQASDAGAALVDATSSQAAGLDIEPAEAAQADPAPVASV